MRFESLATLAAIGLISTSLDASAASAVAFGPAAWGASDAVLGVAGHVIEDFEDTQLANGLEVQVLPPSLSGYGPTATLPFTFDPGVDDQTSNAFVGSAWDGTRSLVNRPFVPITSYANDGGWSDVRFLFDAGVTSLGFSIQQAEANIGISLDLGGGFTFFLDSSSLLAPGGGRVGYLRIDAAPGEVIYGVHLDNQAGNHDGIAYDHLAFQPAPVPLPAGAWLLGPALVTLAVRGRRRA
ncbi:MAG: hypothetical protein AB7P42_07675 [Gammaproteobacteria bacterium]